MNQDFGAAEKIGRSMPVDAGAVGGELKTPGLSEDDRRMLSLIAPHFKEKPKRSPNLRYWVVSLVPALLVGLSPFAVLFLIVKNNIKPRYASLDMLPVFAGCWAIFAVWITLHKGIGNLSLADDDAGSAWLLLGLINVIAALGTLFVLGIS